MSDSRQALLITGAARRLGRGIALEFARNGYDIALHYHRSAQEAEETAIEIRKLGRECLLLQQNLEDVTAMQGLVQQAQKAFPYLNALVNNASVFNRISFMETTPETLWRDYTINFAQGFFLTQAFSKVVQHGAVINLLDTAIHTNRTTHFAYLLAKKTLHEFTLMAARELAPHIRVNAVCPGFILPTENGENRDPAAYAARLPLKKQPTPQDVAQAVLMLAQTPSLIGQIVTIDGGERLL